MMRMMRREEREERREKREERREEREEREERREKREERREKREERGEKREERREKREERREKREESREKREERRNGQCVLNSVIENKRILYETYLTSYVGYFCYLLMIYLNTLPRYGEIKYAGKNTCISVVWSVGVIILMCSGALRSGSERSEGVGNSGWWKHHIGRV